MTADEMVELFEKHNESFLKFEPKDGTKRPDLAGFVLLDRLVPGDDAMVSGAEHDKIWLSPDLDELAKVVTEDDVMALVRCGIGCDNDGLWKFV